MNSLFHRFADTLFGDWIFSPHFFVSCWTLSALSAAAMVLFEWDTRTMVFLIVALLALGWCSYFANLHIGRLRASGQGK